MTPDELRKQLGLYVTVGYGEAFPALKGLYARIVTDKVATWPWLPRTWASDYLAQQALDPRALVRIAPARVVIPNFCDTAAKVAAWNDLAAKLDLVVNKYSENQAAAGAAEAQAIYANARFWHDGIGAGLITVATAIANAPATIVGGVVDGAGAVAGGLLKRLFSSWLVWAVLLGGVGFFAWRSGLLKLPKSKGR